jgi:hypothetical protein
MGKRGPKIGSIRKILTGMRFGRLTVVGFYGNKGKRPFPHWRCQCDCKNFVVVYRGNLLRKTHAIKSCGCAKREFIQKRNRIVTALIKAAGRIDAAPTIEPNARSYPGI